MEAVEQSQGLRAELFRIAQSVVLGAVTGGIVTVDHGAIEITDLLLYITIDRRYQSSSLKVLKKNTIIDRSFMTNCLSFSNSLVSFQNTITWDHHFSNSLVLFQNIITRDCEFSSSLEFKKTITYLASKIDRGFQFSSLRTINIDRRAIVVWGWNDGSDFVLQIRVSIFSRTYGTSWGDCAFVSRTRL